MAGGHGVITGPAGLVSLVGGASAYWTGRAHGDLSPHSPAAAANLARLAGRPVVRLRQVHGAGVVTVAGPDAPAEGDALVTASASVALAVCTADCAPLALASPEGVVAAVHAGWRGLVAGVVEAAVAAMRRAGATTIHGALGPCIHAECYAFGPAELGAVAARLGPTVLGRTRVGGPALDLPAAVRAALAGAGGELVHADDRCTACAAGTCFSHRARGETERQAMVVWKA